MKVLKFGGSSVGTAQSISSVKRIVESTEQPVIVVVSALGGVTDKLISVSKQAASSDAAYRTVVDELQARHHQLIADVVPGNRQAKLTEQIDALFEEMRSILHGVFLIQDLVFKTKATVLQLPMFVVKVLVNHPCKDNFIS